MSTSDGVISPGPSHFTNPFALRLHSWRQKYSTFGTNVASRKGRLRHEDFRRFQFDPDTDVAIDDNGAWRWNTNKQEMHEHVREYFASRREDG